MIQYLILCGIFLVVPLNCFEVEEIFSWKLLDFNWPDADFKNNAIKSGAYVAENNNLHGISIWKNKIFTVTPRYRPGVASSLNYIEISDKKSPKLTPYPSWDVNFLSEEKENSLKDNSSVVSSFRSWVDDCDRLWVIDSGTANISSNRISIAKPAIVIFDLKTDTLVRRYELKDSHVKKSSLLLNIIVDVYPETCEEAYAYVADTGNFALIVYSFGKDNSWCIHHHYFHFSPLETNYHIGGINFQWADGIFGMTLSKKKLNGYRILYFHSLSSTTQFFVYNRVLQNETWATSHENFHDFVVLGYRGPETHSTITHHHENTEVIFYTQVKRNGVACWNSRKMIKNSTFHLFVSDSTKMEFVSDLEVANDTLWMLSNKLPKFIYDALDEEDINFRIMKIPVYEAIKGTPCE